MIAATAIVSQSVAGLCNPLCADERQAHAKNAAGSVSQER